jgi:hypothetical protein
MATIMLTGVALYFNVSRAQYLVPLECNFLSGLNCLDASVDETLVMLSVVNEFGFVISNISMNMTGTCNSTANTSDGNPYGNLNVLLANKQTTYVFECQNLTNMRVTEKLSVSYRNLETGEGHVKVGKLQYSPTG